MKMPEKVTIRHLINSRKVFCVPKYQRTYAWEDEEIDDFIKDILALYTYRITGKAVVEHFLGGFVSIEEQKVNTQPAHKYQVVDGQQRLTTILIGLSLLVRSFDNLAALVTDNDEKEKAVNFADSTKNFLRYDQLDNLTGKKTTPLTLTLSKTDGDFFTDLIDGKWSTSDPEPQISSHARLFYALKKIEERILSPIIKDTTLSDGTKIDRLITLQNAFLDDCYVIHIISETTTEGYRLFSILNDRGQRLSDADLLRSHTLSLLDGDPKQDKLEKYWDHLAEGSFGLAPFK